MYSCDSFLSFSRQTDCLNGTEHRVLTPRGSKGCSVDVNRFETTLLAHSQKNSLKRLLPIYIFKSQLPYISIFFLLFCIKPLSSFFSVTLFLHMLTSLFDFFICRCSYLFFLAFSTFIYLLHRYFLFAVLVRKNKKKRV